MTQSAFTPEGSSAVIVCMAHIIKLLLSHVCRASVEIKTEEPESLHGKFMHWHALARMIIEAACADAENALMP